MIMGKWKSSLDENGDTFKFNHTLKADPEFSSLINLIDSSLANTDLDEETGEEVKPLSHRSLATKILIPILYFTKLELSKIKGFVDGILGPR